MLAVPADTHASEPHSAIICEQTGCGKTQFVLDELLHPERGSYRNSFDIVFIMCPTWKRNRTYLIDRGFGVARMLLVHCIRRASPRLASAAFQLVCRHTDAVHCGRHVCFPSLTKKERHAFGISIQWAPCKTICLGARAEV